MKSLAKKLAVMVVGFMLSAPAFAATRNIVPRADNEGGIGTAAKTWNIIYVKDAAVDFGVTAATAVISGTGADSLDIGGGLNAGTGNVAIIDTSGKIPALSSTYLANLSGANLTAITAANISAGSLGGSVIASSIAVGAVYDNAVLSIAASKVNAGSLGSEVIASSIAVGAVYDKNIISLPAISGAPLTSLTAANIATGNLPADVVASSIAVDAVYTKAIAASAVTDAKINDVAPGKVTAGSLDSDVIASSVALAGFYDNATIRTNLGLAAGGAGDIWVEKAGDTMTGPFVPYLRTITEMDALAGVAGGLISCSNCSVPYTVCVGSGTGVGAWTKLNSADHCQ